jgi:hypothetical protein
MNGLEYSIKAQIKKEEEEAEEEVSRNVLFLSAIRENEYHISPPPTQSTTIDNDNNFIRKSTMRSDSFINYSINNNGLQQLMTAASSNSDTFSLKSSKLIDELIIKLKSMNEPPDYLIKQSKINNTNIRSDTSNSPQTSYYTDDFILLSEFSEIEGPRPLLTIPTDGGTKFNKNDYSLHLMCVDFHSSRQQQKNVNKFNSKILNFY